MPERQFTTPLDELPSIYRPQHTVDFPIWEYKKRAEVNLPLRPGYLREFVDGTKYVLAQNGATELNPAEYVESVITRINETNITKAARILSNRVVVEVGTTSVEENDFAGGDLFVVGGTGAGHRFPINGNTEGGGTAADTIIVYLAVQLPLALALDSDVSIYSSPYRNMRQGTEGLGSSGQPAPRGIPNITVPANMMFFLQKSGRGMAKMAADIAVGNAARALATTTDGELSVLGNAVSPAVATLLDPSAIDVSANAYALVDMDF